MKGQVPLLLTLVLIVFPVVSSIQAGKEFSIYDALALCEKNEVGDFSSVVRKAGFWEIKARNLNNRQECVLHISLETGLIDYCLNVTPKDIVIGENTYGYSGRKYGDDGGFYFSELIVNGLKIYRNDSFYFRMKQGIFIKNGEEYAAYYMYKGPDLTKGGKE